MIKPLKRGCAIRGHLYLYETSGGGGLTMVPIYCTISSRSAKEQHNGVDYRDWRGDTAQLCSPHEKYTKDNNKHDANVVCIAGINRNRGHRGGYIRLSLSSINIYTRSP